MKLKLVIAISAFAAMPAFAQAKHGETPPTNPKSTLAQVQKVIQIIMGNKTKLHQYCEIAKLDPQIADAHRRSDINTLEVLVKRAEMEGLAQIDENSREGKQIADALDSLDKFCTR